MMPKALAICCLIGFWSCRERLIDETVNPSIGQLIVYINGKLHNYTNSSYSKLDQNGNLRFYLLLDENYEDYALLSRIACIINKPEVGVVLSPVGYDTPNPLSSKVDFIQLVEQDLPGPKYKYDLGLGDFVMFESLDTMSRTFAARGILTFTRVSIGLINRQDQKIVVEFAVNSYYEAK